MTSKAQRLSGLAKELDALAAASSSTLIVYEYTATAGQTVFSGADNNGLTLNYIAGNTLVVYNEGVLQKTVDYATTSSSVLTLASGAEVGALVRMYAFGTFAVANVYTKPESDALYYNKTQTDAYRTANRPIYCYRTRTGASGAGSKILFDDAATVTSDASIWDATNWRFVVPEDGVYEIHFTGMRVGGSGSNRVLIGLMDNAPTSTNCLAQSFDGSASAQTQSITTVVRMTAGQWVCVYVAAGTVGFFGGETKPYQYFSIKRIAL
jgi:hypothetical protein